MQNSHVVAPKKFTMEIYKGMIEKHGNLHGNLQRNDRKMTISWSFFYNSFVNFSLLITWSVNMDPKHKGTALYLFSRFVSMIFGYD